MEYFTLFLICLLTALVSVMNDQSNNSTNELCKKENFLTKKLNTYSSSSNAGFSIVFPLLVVRKNGRRNYVTHTMHFFHSDSKVNFLNQTNMITRFQLHLINANLFLLIEKFTFLIWPIDICVRFFLFSIPVLMHLHIKKFHYSISLELHLDPHKNGFYLVLWRFSFWISKYAKELWPNALVMIW